MCGSSSARLKEFCESSTAHGFAHLVKGSHRTKICWTVILISSVLCTIFHLSVLTSKYLQYDYHEVTTRTTDDGRLTFPDVTICDSVRFSDSALLKTTFTKDLLQLVQNLTVALSEKNENLSAYTPEDRELFRQRVHSTRGIFANIPPEQREPTGTQFENLVVNCLFGDQPCARENFQVFVNPTFFNCYTFKANTMGNENDPLVGPESGLSLILKSEPSFILTYDTLSKVGNINSIRVHIHQPGTLPFTANYGLDILPGMSTSVELNQKDYIRLGTPYSDCKSETNITYASREFVSGCPACFNECLRRKIYEICHCVSTLFGGVADDNRDHCTYVDLSRVQDLNFSRLLCESKWSRIFARNSRTICSHCVWRCKETRYETKVSQALWPQDTAVPELIRLYVLSKPNDNPVREYYEHLLNTVNFNESYDGKTKDRGQTVMGFLQTLSAYSANPDFDLDVNALENITLSLHIPESLRKSKSLLEMKQTWVRESFYRLNVYFSYPFVTVSKQVATFTFDDFWSAVGGVLGIWAGASVVTVLEFISFICDLISAGRSKTKPKLNEDNCGLEKSTVVPAGPVSQ